jgi:hypothetical protein
MKTNQTKKPAWGVVQVVEYLPSKFKPQCFQKFFLVSGRALGAIRSFLLVEMGWAGEGGCLMNFFFCPD